MNPALPDREKLPAYALQLLREGESLKNEFRSMSSRFGRYSPCHQGYSQWKRRVLAFVGSLGVKNPYLAELLDTEAEYSHSCPARVFDSFLKIMGTASELADSGICWGQAAAEAPEEVAEPFTPVAPPSMPVANPAPPPEEKTVCAGDPHEAMDSEALAAYSGLLAGARRIIDQAGTVDEVSCGELDGICSFVLAKAESNPMLLAYAAAVTTENYLYAHTVNVLILSQFMAMDKGLSEEERRLLCVCALAHDIGMRGFHGLYSQKGALNDAEFAEISGHVSCGAKEFCRAASLEERFSGRLFEVVRQTHERADGSGYPARLACAETDPLARIIGVADAYESMTHARSWREPLHPCEAMKELAGQGGAIFDIDATKSLIRVLSFYPPSSWVMLMDGSIGRVLRSRAGRAAKPLVEVALDRTGAPVKRKLLDVGRYPLFAIERPVQFSEIRRIAPEFAGWHEALYTWADPPREDARLPVGPGMG